MPKPSKQRVYTFQPGHQIIFGGDTEEVIRGRKVAVPAPNIIAITTGLGTTFFEEREGGVFAEVTEGREALLKALDECEEAKRPPRSPE